MKRLDLLYYLQALLRDWYSKRNYRSFDASIFLRELEIKFPELKNLYDE